MSNRQPAGARGLELAQVVANLCDQVAEGHAGDVLAGRVAVAGAVLLETLEAGDAVLERGRLESASDPLAPPAGAEATEAVAWLLAAARSPFVEAVAGASGTPEAPATRRAAMLLEAAGFPVETLAVAAPSQGGEAETSVCEAVAEAAGRARLLYEASLLGHPAAGFGTAGLGMNPWGWLSRRRRR